MSEVLSGIVAKAREAMTDGIDLILVIAGEGGAAALLEVVRSWFPEQTTTIADETLTAAIGFALFYWGGRIHKRVVPFGFGVFLAGVGAWSATWVAQAILTLKKAPAG